jgi:hypothetical protein
MVLFGTVRHLGIKGVEHVFGYTRDTARGWYLEERSSCQGLRCDGGQKAREDGIPSLDGPLRSMIDKDVQWVKGMEWGV